MAKISEKVAQRIATNLRKFQPIIANAKARDINEADTAHIIREMLSDILGYDKFTEITAEHCIKNTYCDYAIHLDGRLVLLIECKAIGSFLKDLHVKQATDYAANHGVDWVVLTNAQTWRIYKMGFSKPVTADQVIEFDILALDAKRAEDLEKLSLLAKEGWSKESLGDYHAQRQALSRFTLAALLISEPVLGVMRRELKRISPDVKISEEEIADVLRNEIAKRETLEGENADLAKKMVSKALRQAKPKSPAGQPARDIAAGVEETSVAEPPASS